MARVYLTMAAAALSDARFGMLIIWLTGN